MVICKETLTDYKELYEKSAQLINEESKADPVTDPYRSHYKARDVLLEMKDKLQTALTSAEADETSDAADALTFKIILAFVCRDLGRIYVYTEEPTTGEEQLKECIQLVEEHKMKREAIISYTGALIELGILYANLQDAPKALEKLILAEEAYKAFKKTALSAMCLTDIFGTFDEIEQGKGHKEFEGLYTLCAFYMAQVFGQLQEMEQSAKYCHMTLVRQLESKSFDHIDFALNAATLSQYFIGQNMFKEARHHLAAATMIIAQHEAQMITPEMTEQQREEITETFKHRYADVARCWAKYGLALLSSSKDRLFNDEVENLKEDVKSVQLDSNEYRFPELELTACESRITADYCLTFDDAKPIYHFVIGWLDQAKEYYKPDTDATEYAKIIKDYAELYMHIAFFEEDPSNQIKMHKRRAKYYEDLLELLNPVFYLAICRECWYGAGQAYSAILDVRLDAMKANNTPAPQDLQKINLACSKAIKHFKEFASSYMEKDGVTLRSNMDVEEQRSVLYAYFYLGRLHYKLMSPDLRMQSEHLTSSLTYYKLFLDGCTEHKEAAEALQAEIGVCREMVGLLPVKLDNLKKRLEK